MKLTTSSRTRAGILVVVLLILGVAVAVAVRNLDLRFTESPAAEERANISSVIGDSGPPAPPDQGAISNEVERESVSVQRGLSFESAAARSTARLSLRLGLPRSQAPLPNVVVKVGLKGSGEWVAATTDSAGVAHFELPPGTLRRVWVSGSDLVPRQTFQLDRTLAPGIETQVRLEVRPGFAVAGRVVDERRRGVPGARVLGGGGLWSTPPSAPEAETTTGPDGSFRIGMFLERVGLFAQAPNRITRQVVGIDLTLGVPDDVEIVLVPAISLRGRVFAASGPVVGANVRASLPGGPPPEWAVTDGEGRFDLAIADLPHALEVAADGFLPWRGDHDPGAGDLIIVLEAGAGLAGTVRDADGTAVGGARVRLTASGPWETPVQTTNDDGRFSFPGLDLQRDATISVVADGYWRYEREAPLRPGENVWDVSLDPCEPITGTVLELDGTPARNVTAYLGLRTDPILDGELHVSTDERGRFRFASLPRASRILVAAGRLRGWYDDPSIRSATVEVRPGSDVTLRLDAVSYRGVALLGSVRDALSGAPVERFWVTYSGGTSGSTKHEYGGGWFERAGYPSDRLIRLVFTAPDHAQRTIDARRYDPGDHHFEILLDPQREVTFRLVTPDGRPAPDAELSVVDRDGHVLSQRTGAGRKANRLRAKSDGLVIARDVPGGPCFVAVAAYPYGPEERQAFDFSVPPSGVVELIVEPVEWIEQTISVYGAAAAAARPLDELLADGAAWPVERARILAQRNVAPQGAAPRWRTVAQQQGPGPSIILALPVTSLRLRIESVGYQTAELPISRPDDAGAMLVFLTAQDRQ